MIIDLVQNIALLIALAALYHVLFSRVDHNRKRYRILSGLLFGSVALAGMLRPVHFAPGIFFDGRTVILSVAGLFGGPLAAFIAVAICAGYRLWIGGGGVVVGVVNIALSALIGVLFHYRRRRSGRPPGLLELWFFGLLVHAVMLLVMLALPAGVVQPVLLGIGPTVLVVFPMATMLISLLFLENERQTAYRSSLERSERDLREAQRLARMGRWEWDAESGRLELSETLFGLFEIAPRAIEASPAAFWNAVHPDDRLGVRRAFIRSLRESSPFDVEHRLLMEDGRVKWVHAFGRSEPGSDDRARRAVGVMQEITESKRAEEAVRNSDRVFRHALDMLCIAGYDGYFKTLNPSWSRVLGWTTEELLARAWIEFVHPDDREATLNVGASLVDGREVYRFENRYRCKDGSFRWLSWDSHPYPDERIMFGVARDVTKQKEAEEALRVSGERLRRVVDGAPFGLFLQDGDSFVFVNRAAAELLGAAGPEALIGQPVAEILPPGFRQALQQSLDAYSKGSRNPRLQEMQVRGGDDPLWLEVAAIPFEEGRRGQQMVFLREISRRKRDEEAMREQLDELRRWQTVTEDRERRVIELKREVNSLLAKQGESPHYDVDA